MEKQIDLLSLQIIEMGHTSYGLWRRCEEEIRPVVTPLLMPLISTAAQDHEDLCPTAAGESKRMLVMGLEQG